MGNLELVKRRDMIVKNNVMNKNQLHSQFLIVIHPIRSSLHRLMAKVHCVLGKLSFARAYLEYYTRTNL